MANELWYVMTNYDMKPFLDWLKTENARRLNTGEAIVEPFYPQEFLKTNGNEVSEDLAAFLFLKSSPEDIEYIVENAPYLSTYKRLRHYLDTNGKEATVPDNMMQAFITACIEYKGQLEITHPITSIEVMDKVRIKKGPFSDCEASVTKVRLSKGAIQLELAIKLVSGAMNIKMSNVSKSQIQILDRSSADTIRTDFIEYTQGHLLNILGHRIKRVDDEETNKRDADMLTRLYRYRNYEIKNDAARHHFQALMLICAHLCRYTQEETLLRERALNTLSEINKKSESKASTDVRTYLWIALYISTHDPVYRDAAKQYVRDYHPKSPKLRRFVSLIREGRKV